MKHACCSRRDFLRIGASLAVASLPLHASAMALRRRNATVAITRCRSYQNAEIRAALERSFDSIGGIGRLVKNKTVTVKLNLTGCLFKKFLDRDAGETYITHPATAFALTAALFDAGARRVRLVESTVFRETLAESLRGWGWDVPALLALGRVELEDTHNLGLGKSYANFKVPGGGRMFSFFELNHSYRDTDVLVSLCKLKLHATAGVTMTMKNLFGVTPNSLYGDEAPGEDRLKFRGRLHDLKGWAKRGNPAPFEPPGATRDFFKITDPGIRVPRLIADLCEALPIHLGIIDGITANNGGEGPWIKNANKITAPGVIIAGFDPVATDAVGMAVMGFDHPRALGGVAPFVGCENHLLMAEQAGLGTADLSRIEVAGVPIAEARSKEYISA